MRQVLFDKKGRVFVEDVPAPAGGDGLIVVKNSFSLLSPGTERAMVDLMKKPLITMAMERKDLTKQVLRFARESGIKQTIELVKSRLDVWHLLGYSSCGTVARVGPKIHNVGVGDLVACCGSGYANHAEFVAVPQNMFAKVPNGVAPEEAAFAGVGAIALQSVRQLEPTLGETHVVLGMGLIGQLVAQLLKANGCNVIGIDVDRKRAEKPYVDLALSSPDSKEVSRFTKGAGADGVIIAAATKANLVNDSFELCRKRGRVVLLGVCGLDIERSKMYEKELDFRISTAFGPGYYDQVYEQKSLDYPIAYVRWTMNRNMEAFLELLKQEKIDVRPLTEEIHDIAQARQAYDKILQGSSMGVLIRYDQKAEPETIVHTSHEPRTGRIRAGLIGAGHFAKAFLIPAMKEHGLHVDAVSTKQGSTCKKVAKELGARYASTDYHALLADKHLDLIVISTQHDLHARIAIEAMKAKKHVYVEKPLAIYEAEFEKLREQQKRHRKMLAVGFNRRYSRLFTELKKHLKRDRPVMLNYVYNNTFLPADHWVNRRDTGGGRILGEACHILDLFNFLTGSEPLSLHADKITSTKGEINDDNNASVMVKYRDGSVCSLAFSCMGNAGHEREACTLFQDGSVFVMSNFKELKKDSRKIFSGAADLGYSQEMAEVRRFIEGKANSLITAKEGLLATEMAFSVMRLLKNEDNKDN